MSDKMRYKDHDTGDHQGEPVCKKRRSEDSSSLSIPDYGSQDDASTAGVIECVTMKNFMCHDYLTFPFSPTINFVQGRNGSGKSAVMTAVVVGLGGSSRLTHRGNSLKELVKYGKHTATIEVSIKNSGRSAFQYEVFGDSIIVERKIVASGGGSYKLKAKNGTVVSTKKEDLTRMLEHFNMQVDNPITVLNQDMSRAFLNTTDPHSLYKFFLKATQLQQMKDDYKQLDSALQASMEIIQSRKESLPYLKNEAEEQRVQYEFCVTLNEKRKKLSELRRELAWAVIIQKEKKEAEGRQKLSEHTKRKDKCETKIEKLTKRLKELEESHRISVDQCTKLSKETKAKSQEVQVANDAVIKAKKEMKDIQGHLNTVHRKIKEIKKEMTLMKNAVERTNNDSQKQWADRRAKWVEEMEKINKSQEETKRDGLTEETHYNNLTNTLDIKRSEHTQVNFEEKALRRKIGALEQEVRELKGQQGNQFTVFGYWVPQLLREIDVAHKKGAFSKKPVGPLGAFVKMRDSKWGHVAEAVLGSRITAFCVDNRSDEQVLRKIMKGINFQRQHPQVIVAKFREKVHDVSRFEVQSDQYPSLWSVLTINNTVVANTIIDMMQVESVLLIPTAEDAGQILKDRTKVPPNCKVAYTLNRDMYYPDPNYRLYSGRGQQPARFLQVSMEQKVRETEIELESLRTEIMMLTQNMTESVKEVRKLEEEVKVSNRKLSANKRTLDQLRFKLAEIQNQEEHPPPDMSQLEEEIKQQETRLAKEQESQATYEQQFVEARKRYIEVSNECDRLRKGERSIFQEAERLLDQANQFGSQKTSVTTSLNNTKKDLQEIIKHEKELKKIAKEESNDLAKELEAAEKFQPRMNTNRSISEVKRLYDGLETRLNKEQSLSGDPATIAKRYKETLERYEKFSSEVEQHCQLIKKIKTSLEMRQGKYKKFRKMISVMVKSNFTVHLSTRKLKGSLQFDFEKQTLTLNVTQMNSNYQELTEDVERGKSGSQNKKTTTLSSVPKLTMMSGGERSFSTVAFIIALWNVILSPIRILDEFDVFMDVVARRRAMNMMIQAAKPGTQYIYLTPLETNFGDLAKNITVFRMQDPKRKENSSSQRNSQ